MNYKERKERILISSWNTIRLTDVPLYKAIDESRGINLPEILHRLDVIERKTPYVTYMGEQDILKRIVELYPDAYYDSPITAMYNILMTVKTNQIESMVIAHNTFSNLIDMSQVVEDDDMISYDQYDGTVEDIERLIIKHNSTAVIIDDIEFLYHIIIRDKIDLHGMTFIFPVLGYNFETIDDNLQYKYMSVINDKIIELDEELEIAFVDLFIFDKQEVDDALK